MNCFAFCTCYLPPFHKPVSLSDHQVVGIKHMLRFVGGRLGVELVINAGPHAVHDRILHALPSLPNKTLTHAPSHLQLLQQAAYIHIASSLDTLVQEIHHKHHPSLALALAGHHPGPA